MIPVKEKKVIFLIPPKVHILDLAGPIEVFHKANEYGANYNLIFSSPIEDVISSSGLPIGKIEVFNNVKINKGDLVIVPGLDQSILNKNELNSFCEKFCKHLHKLNSQGVIICAICSGAFIIAHAGLLDNKECTTNWRYIKKLGNMYPSLKIKSNCLFVKKDNIYTSAGATSGIDLSLSIVDEDHGPVFAAKVARALVVFIRRNGCDEQLSIYLDFRSHLNPGIHIVQSYIVNHADQKNNIESLSEIAAMSPRNLTRLFKKETGITIKEYSNKVKIELGKHLMNNPNMSIEAIANECGFSDPRQFQRLWKSTFNTSPSYSRLQLKSNSRQIRNHSNVVCVYE